MTDLNYLALSWSISRGRDTYGYNICRLDDRRTDKRYKCMGGGYDMIGTCLGEWLQDVYQDRLVKLAANHEYIEEAGYTVKGYFKHKDLYGITFKIDGAEVKATVDGACGVESVIRIAEAVGIRITRDFGRNKTLGFFVS